MLIDYVLPYLDTERLAEIFKQRIKNPNCPFCGNEEWALPLPPGITGVGLPWCVGGEYFDSAAPAVMLFCKCCGFMRLHSIEALEGVLVRPDTPGTDSQKDGAND